MTGTAHAPLSPSGAERWYNCPGSVVLSEGMPSKSSAHADEGTLAHEIAAHILLGDEVACDTAMLKHLAVYTAHVQALPGKLHVEVAARVNDETFGTADAVVWDAETATLHVRDLKYGAGVAVEVEDNLQLQIYALAVLLTMGYRARVVTVGIIQPRCPHPDGPVRVVEFLVVDLLEFHAGLIAAQKRVAQAVADAKGEAWNAKHLKPTKKGCRWCLAAPVCPALKGLANAGAKTAFSSAVPYDPADLSATLATLDVIEGWCKSVREFAYAEAERGAEVPGWKLVEKRATRKWASDGSIAALQERAEFLHLGLDATLLYETKPITPAAAAALLPKEHRDLVDTLTVRESSGHTLVPESDKRQAVRLDAASAFANC